MLKFGLCKEKGCQGKTQKSEEFYPKLCPDHIKGKCDGFECGKGFHLRSISKKNRQAAKHVNEPEPRATEQVPKVAEHKGSEEQTSNVTNDTNKSDEPPFLEQDPNLLNKLLQKL